jgi:glycosyltransferase involved in cell wall biosynthesis
LLFSLVGQLRIQDYPRDTFEIVIVDNCSTDHTLQIVERLIAQPGVPVIYVCETRLGITFARNRGAEVARYPYLAYLDDDCSIEPDWLSKLVQGFDLHHDVVAVGGRVVLDWSQFERPAWLGPELESWIGANGYLGSQPRLLEKNVQILEGNMAVKREAWNAFGGFLGMEQFGSRHMAAGEVHYMLQKLRQQKGQIAYAPQAVATHRMGKYTRRRFLERAYWQGVSDGILDYLIYRRSWLSTINHILLDAAAMIILLGCAGFYCLMTNQAKIMYCLIRAIRRFALILSKMRLVGNWSRIALWVSGHAFAD